MKNFLLYLAMIILIVLLFLPKGLRLFAKDLYKETEKPKDVIESLSCNKLNESMNISYLNGKTYNLSYNITGNYEFETDNTETESTNQLNPTKDLRGVATIDYNQVADMTTFKIDLSSVENVQESLILYTMSIDEERDLLSQNGFSCTKSSIN